MHLQSHQHPPAPPASTTFVVSEDVQWGRPIFRAPALTGFAAIERQRPLAPAFPARRFQAAGRKALAEI